MGEKKPRATNVEMDKRISAIEKWIIDGVPSALIIKQIIEYNWCTSDRHAERLLQKARLKWVQYEDEDVLMRRKLKIQQLQQLKRTLQKKYEGTPDGIRAIMAIEKEIIKLDGIAAPVKLEVSGNAGQPIQQNITCEVVFKDYSTPTDG